MSNSPNPNPHKKVRDATEPDPDKGVRRALNEQLAAASSQKDQAQQTEGLMTPPNLPDRSILHLPGATVGGVTSPSVC